MRHQKVFVTLLVIASQLVSVSGVYAQSENPNDDVNLSSKRQITLNDKLQEAIDEQKPIVVLFGDQKNPDLENLAKRVNEINQDTGKPSILLVIDPTLEPEDSALKPYIDEHITNKKGLHTAVLPVHKGKNGKPELGKPAFSADGYKFQIPDQIQKSLSKAKQTMAVKAGLGTQGTSGTSQNTQASPQVQGNTQTKVSLPKASDLKHLNPLAASISDARDEMLKAANANGLDVKRMTVRTLEFERSAKHHKVADSQVIATYETITKMIESKTNGPFFNDTHRKNLCELALHNVARPRCISQGNHPTCNVTTLEVYIACRYPEIYADIILQVVQTGTYTTNLNEKISPPKEAFMPGDDERSFDMDIPYVSKRNHASQVVEMLLVNGVYETGRYTTGYDAKGNKIDTTGRRYIVGPPKKTWFQINGNQWAYTTDEDELIDKHGNPVLDRNGKPQKQPSLTGEDILEASKMVLGYEMPYLEAPYQITGQPWVYDLPTAKRLLGFKTRGEIPLGVHTMGGMHVQTIHDVIVVNNVCWVLIDNQRGLKDDGWITLDTLHKTQKSMNYHFTPQQTKP